MLAFVILFILAVADRLIKISALNHPHQTIALLWRIFWYMPYANTASLIALPISPDVALVIAAAIGIFCFYLFLRTDRFFTKLAFGFIAIGVLSNAYDRYAFGYVIDVFRVVNSISFNVADIFIALGIALILPALVLP